MMKRKVGMVRKICCSLERWFLVALLAVAITGCGSDSKSPTTSETAQPRNIIVMISDGASFGSWDAASLFQYTTTTGPVYYDQGFDKYLMTTYPLNTSSTPTGGQTPEIDYDPEQAWDLTSYNSTATGYLHQNFTDSAAAGTALSTGIKTYNNAMNWGNDPVATGSIITPTMPELAKQNGKVVGTISSVQWSHATPAAFSNAHNITRNDYVGIANQMLDEDIVDVIMGAGHPQWNDSGTQIYPAYDDTEINDSRARYVGGRDTWIQLKEGTHPGNLTLVETKGDFEALAQGDLSVLGGKNRLVGTAQAGSTLQQSRSGYSATDAPFSTQLNEQVPSLGTMATAALNVLSSLDQGKGLFLHIEGGAVDWAAHANQTSRIVEEQIEFNLAVDAVVEWIEQNGGWEENLLIITTDHGNAMPMGPGSDLVPHARISLNNVIAGQYSSTNPQGVRWWSGNHTNELVPLFARGTGADYFADLAVNQDDYFAQYYPDWGVSGFDGRYVDNTDVYKVMERATVQVQ